MDEGTGESLLGWQRRRSVTRKSTLVLYFRRVSAKFSIRWGTLFILIVLIIFYASNREPSSTKLGEWSSQLQYKGRRTSPKEWQRRADAVKEAFLHAYNTYESNAFPRDELRPLSGEGIQM